MFASVPFWVLKSETPVKESGRTEATDSPRSSGITGKAEVTTYT